MNATLLFVALVGLCWGSFLNMIAHRLLHGDFDRVRSFCPHCKTTLAWYDLIPLISFALLRGRCRSCSGTISILYPLIELLTTGITVLLWLQLGQRALPSVYHEVVYLVWFGLFFSGLLIAVRTDLEEMVIPRIVPLILLPIGLLGALLSITSVSVAEALAGCLLGYGILWGINAAYRRLRGIDGIGGGDMDLLSVIGMFVGPSLAMYSLAVASLGGTCASLVYLLVTKQGTQTRIPFVPFLALGAAVVVCL